MTDTRTTVGNTSSTVRLLQAGALLSLAALFWQFLTAGQLITTGGALGGHQAGAIALHVGTGLTALAAVLLARSTGAWWVAGLAGLVFLLTFVQAYVGSYGPLAVHVPLAMLVTAGAVWVAVYAFRSPGRR